MHKYKRHTHFYQKTKYFKQKRDSTKKDKMKNHVNKGNKEEEEEIAYRRTQKEKSHIIIKEHKIQRITISLHS